MNNSLNMNGNRENIILKEKIEKLEFEIKDYKNKLGNIAKEGTNELKLSEEKFRLLFERSHDPIFIIDDDKIFECNEAAVEILRYENKEEVCKVHLSILAPQYQPDGKLSNDKLKEMINLAFSNGYHRFEWVYLNKMNEKLYIDVSLTKIPYKHKEVIFTIWRDISTQKANENKYSILFEQAADGILVGIKGGEIVEANESMVSLSGYTKDELVGKNISMLFEKDELNGKPLRYDLVKSGDTVVRERNIKRKDGNIIIVEMKSKILDDGRMQALFRDISKRRKAENDARKNSQLLETAEKIAGLGRFFYDINSDHWESSDVLNNIFGIDENYSSDLQGWLNIIHPSFREEMRKYFLNNVIKKRERFNKVYKIKRIKDKKELWVHGYGDLIFDESDNPVSVIGTIQDINEQKEVELALKTSEQKYRSIFHHSPLGIFHYDINGVITDCNDYFVDIIGSSKQRLIGLKMVTELRDKKIIDGVKKSLIDGKAYYEGWYQSVTANKKTYVRTMFRGIVTDNNKIISGIGLVEDITERRKAEQELKESEEKFKTIATLLPEVVFEIDLEGNIKFVNLKAFEIFEYEEKDFEKGLSIFQMITPSEVERAKKNLSKINETHKVIGERYKAITKSGKEFPVLIYYDVVKSEGKIAGLRGIIINITDIDTVQKNLEQSEKKFRMLFEGANDSIFLMNNEIFIECNDKTLEMFACKKEQIIGQPPYIFSPEYQPDGRKSKEKAKEMIKYVLEHGSSRFEWMHTRYDGSEFNAEVSLNRFDYGGKPIIQAIVSDITERKKSERLLKESEEKFRNIYDNSSDIIIILNDDGKVINANDSLFKNLGYTKKEFLGKTPDEYIAQNDINEVNDRISQMLKGRKVSIKEITMISKSGERLPFEVNSKLINYEGGKAILSVIRNIKERKELQQKVLETIIETEEKERERLAGDIHDEIGPLLSSLKMYIELLNDTNNSEKQSFIKSKLQTLIIDSINNVREVSNAISPYLLNKYGLVTATKSFIDTFKDLITINFEANLNKERFETKHETVYYRILKELINNTIKHAKAKNINIHLNFVEGKLVLNYNDDGIGLKKEKKQNMEVKGMGLLNIINRAKSINGKYRFTEKKPQGFGFELITSVDINK